MNIGIATSEENLIYLYLGLRGIWIIYVLILLIIYFMFLIISFFSVVVVWILINVVYCVVCIM